MPMTCSILGCSSRYSKEKNIKFFSFPRKDKCRLTAWLNAIKRDNWTPSKYDTVCNKHFTANDFLFCKEAYKTFLRPTSVPSIFPSIKRKKYNLRKIDNGNNKKNKEDNVEKDKPYKANFTNIPSSIKRYNLRRKDNGNNKKNKEDNVEKNNKPNETNFTNIHDNTDSIKIDQDKNDSHINIQSKTSNETIENMHTIVDVIEKPSICNINIHNNIILETSNQEIAATEKPCITSSSIYKPMEIEMKQVNNYDSLNSIKLHHIKSLPTPTEVDLRHKIRMLQQKLRRRDAKIIYLRRLLTHLKQKKEILSVIQHL